MRHSTKVTDLMKLLALVACETDEQNAIALAQKELDNVIVGKSELALMDP